MWELVLCKYCAAKGIHVGCGKLNTSNLNWECYDCTKTLQNVQEGSEMNNDTDATPSTSGVNQNSARRKRLYFSGIGGSRRTKPKYSVNSSLFPAEELPPKSPVIPSTVTGITDDDGAEFIEISDSDDSDEILDDRPGKASNTVISEVSGAMFPASLVESRSCSMPVNPYATHDNIEPSVSGTARGSLLKFSLRSENPHVGIAYLDQVPRIAQQIRIQVSCFIFL
jgi:hypothetical protein